MRYLYPGFASAGPTILRPLCKHGRNCDSAAAKERLVPPSPCRTERSCEEFLPPSGCVSFQALARHFFGDHSVLFLSMALRMTSSLRMQAVMTTLKGLPAASRRLAKFRMTGL